MTEAGDLVEGLIVKPGAHGRRTYSRRAKRELVKRCKAAGVSVAGLALAHGINANLLRRWIERYGDEAETLDEGRAEQRATLLPVKMADTQSPQAAVADSSIEISFRSVTIRVRGMVDARVLATVLDCLAQRA